MKLLLPVLLLVAAAGAGWLVLTRSGPSYEPPQEQPIAYAPAPTVLTRPAADGEAVRVLDVEGMCCKSCAGKLHARLLEQPGVRLAAVDFDAGRAEAVVAADVTAAILAAALTFEKYAARPHADG
jgi:copper chaperone CopZ